MIATYCVSITSYCLLWKAYKHVSLLRAVALESPEVKAEQFAIIVRDIPQGADGQTRKEQVDSYFKKIYPETFYRSLIVTDNKKVTSWQWFSINFLTFSVVWVCFCIIYLSCNLEKFFGCHQLFFSCLEVINNVDSIEKEK